jgi:hypothetical protein
MRAVVVVGTIVAAFISTQWSIVGHAQVYQLPTPAPQVTAAGADWFVQGEPVYYAGDLYYPTGPTQFFDGNIMVRVGTYRGVPVFTDTTLQPYSAVLVPIGRNLMRPYERRRTGELAGTIGSRTPSFPVDRDFEASVVAGLLNNDASFQRFDSGIGPASATPRAPAATAASSLETVLSAPPRPDRTAVESILKPESNLGIWIEFQGAKYYSAGDAVTYSPNRFVKAGEYHKTPVYREITGSPDLIYVPAIAGGPIAPFQKR